MDNKWILVVGIIAAMQFSGLGFAATTDTAVAATNRDTAGESVPDWVFETFEKLVQSGALQRSEYRLDSNHKLSRSEAAVLAAEAIWRLEDAPQIEGTPPCVMVTASRGQIEQLKREFAHELNDLGYGALDEARRLVSGDTKRFKISGELRYNYVENHGPRPTVSDDSRLRMRLNGSWDFNEDWTAYTMIESDKSFFQPERRDGHLKWERYYVKGKMGDVSMTAGHFGYLLAEGNIYDSTFQGLIAEFGDPVKVRVGQVRTGDNGRGYLVSASGGTLAYQAEGGLYQYDDYGAGRENTIGYLGGNYFLGRYSLGAMYLRSNLQDSVGDDDGYVMTMGYGKLKTWQPGSYSLYAKHYNQASGTYIAHTMTGSAGYMEGFKGYGLGGVYTVRDHLVYGIDYYDLEDKVTGKRGKTLWNQITYYF